MANDLIPPTTPKDGDKDKPAPNDSGNKYTGQPQNRLQSATPLRGKKSHFTATQLIECGGIAFILWIWSEIVRCHDAVILCILGLALLPLYGGFCHFIYNLIKQFRWALQLAISVWILLTVLTGIIAWKNSQALLPVSQPSPPPKNNIAEWQPPELPPGCSNVYVFIGTTRIEVPIWLAKLPHAPTYTNSFGSNYFEGRTASNVSFAVDYRYKEKNTNEDVITYSMNDLPTIFVTNAEKMPNYSPRQRQFSCNSQPMQVQLDNGEIVNAPVWPLVASNRLFVDVIIPFIEERHRILMDTNLEIALTNLPDKWDINYNSNKCEIVNEETNPVLQVVYKSPSEILVNGIFIVDECNFCGVFNAAPLFVNPSVSFERMLSRTDHKLDTNFIFRYKFPNQKAIFKYPSWKYFHVLAN
jgi:hypothetical protein